MTLLDDVVEYKSYLPGTLKLFKKVASCAFSAEPPSLNMSPTDL